jgi:mRNA-degrading endonuclease RelE of RelBE toxin-antitoxin system
MTYEIEYTLEARQDLNSLRRFEQQHIVDAIDAQLQYEPNVVTNNRKRLRPNELAEWELRVDNFRVFYDVRELVRIVRIVAVGYKRGNRLFIHGEEYEL